MKKKFIIVITLVVILGITFLADGSSGDTTVSDDYDTAYYVEGDNNLFIKLAKTLDKCCFYVVDIFISGIGNIFDSILG